MIEDTYDFAADAIAQALGEDVLYGGLYTIRAVFGAGFQRVQSGSVRISSTRPEISVRLNDLSEAQPGMEPEEGHAVEVRGRPFEVVTVQPDMEGVTATLVLKATD